jgi:hypothetical protein
MNNFSTEPQEAALTDLNEVLKFLDPDLTRWNFWTGVPTLEGLADAQCRYGTFGELEAWLLEQSRLGHRICIQCGHGLIPLIEPGARKKLPGTITIKRRFGDSGFEGSKITPILGRSFHC